MIQNQTCERVVRNQIIQSAHCFEEHLFRPFSSDANGAKTTVTQELTYLGKQKLADDDSREFTAGGTAPDAVYPRWEFENIRIQPRICAVSCVIC